MNPFSDRLVRWTRVAPPPDSDPALTFIEALRAMSEEVRREQLANFLGNDAMSDPDSDEYRRVTYISNALDMGARFQKSPDEVEEERFASTPPVEEGDLSGNLSNQARSDLMRILFRLRRGDFQSEKLSIGTAHERFVFGDSLASLGATVANIAYALSQIQDLDEVAEVSCAADPITLARRKHANQQMRTQQIYAAGAHVLQAFIGRDVESLGSVSKMAKTLRDGDSPRALKTKMKAGGTSRPHHLETVMPVALNRILCRRCPRLSKASGLTFTAGKISPEEIVEEVVSLQSAAVAKPRHLKGTGGSAEAVATGVDAAALSKWIKRVGLKPYMVADRRGRPKKKP